MMTLPPTCFWSAVLSSLASPSPPSSRLFPPPPPPTEEERTRTGADFGAAAAASKRGRASVDNSGERERLQWRTTLLWGEGRGGRGVKGGSGGGGGEGSLSCAVLLLLYVRTHSVPHSPPSAAAAARPPRKDGAPFSSPPSFPHSFAALSLSNPTRPKSLRRRG